MIYLVESVDYIWKKATIEWLTQNWPKVDSVYLPHVGEKWLSGFLLSADHIVIRSCDKVSEHLSSVLKPCRDRNWIFECNSLPSTTFKRRLQKLGKWITSQPGSPEISSKIEALARQMGAPQEICHRFYTLTDAYWFMQYCHLASLKDSPPYKPDVVNYVLRWTPGVLTLNLKQLLRVVGGLARVLNQIQLGANKWRLVQECLHVDSACVTEYFRAGHILSEDVSLLSLFINRVLVLSSVLEECPPGLEPPMSYLYLKLSALSSELLKQPVLCVKP